MMNFSKILAILCISFPLYGMETEKESRKRKIEDIEVQIDQRQETLADKGIEETQQQLSFENTVEEFKKYNLLLDQYKNMVQVKVTDQFAASQDDLSCGYTTLLNGVLLTNFLKGKESCSTLSSMLTNVPLIKVMCLDRGAAWRNIIVKARKRKMLANFVCNRLLLSLKDVQKKADKEGLYTLAFKEGSVIFTKEDPAIEAFCQVIRNVKSYLADFVIDGVRECLQFDSIFEEFKGVYFFDKSIFNGLLEAKAVTLTEHEIRLILKKVIEKKIKDNAGTEDEGKFNYSQLATDDAINAYFPHIAEIRFIITPYSVAEISSKTSLLLSGEANAINNYTIRDTASIRLEDFEWNKIKEAQAGDMLAGDEMASLAHHFTYVKPDNFFSNLFIVFADRLMNGALKEQLYLNENLSKLQEFMKDSHSKGVYCVCLFTAFHWITVVVSKNKDERFYVISNSAHNNKSLREPAFIELLELLGEQLNEEDLAYMQGITASKSKDDLADWGKNINLEQILNLVNIQSPVSPLMLQELSPVLDSDSFLDFTGIESQVSSSEQAQEEQVNCTICSRLLLRKEALAYQSSYLCSNCMSFLI